MKYVEFDKCNLIPTDKIVAVIIDAKEKKITLWLEGGFTFILHFVDEQEAKNAYNTIKESINEVLL